jgi:hypothetical protein
MFFRKINNATLWEKITQLRKYIQAIKDFKTRNCFGCGKSLNIYDFLSDNLEFSPEYILKLWQTPVLEFHCCECFKYLKIDELKKIEEILDTRECKFCDNSINLYKYAKDNSYLKIHELKNEWLNLRKPIFCDNLCQRKYFKIKYNALNKKK